VSSVKRNINRVKETKNPGREKEKPRGSSDREGVRIAMRAGDERRSNRKKVKPSRREVKVVRKGKGK